MSAASTSVPTSTQVTIDKQDLEDLFGLLNLAFEGFQDLNFLLRKMVKELPDNSDARSMARIGWGVACQNMSVVDSETSGLKQSMLGS